MKERLLSLLKEYSIKRGEFDLSNGGKSDIYIDCKQTLLLSEGVSIASDLIIDAIADIFYIDLVAAVELGACPLATAVSLKCSENIMFRDAVNALYIRKSIKDHGTKNLIEGIYNPGQSVILLEDTITSGHSCLNALAALRDAELNPLAVICVVDRLVGGKEAIREHFNIPAISLFTIDDLR